MTEMRSNGKCPHGHNVETIPAGGGWVVDHCPNCKICLKTGWRSTAYKKADNPKE
jgi:hypothetical protein